MFKALWVWSKLQLIDEKMRPRIVVRTQIRILNAHHRSLFKQLIWRETKMTVELSRFWFVFLSLRVFLGMGCQSKSIYWKCEVKRVDESRWLHRAGWIEYEVCMFTQRSNASCAGSRLGLIERRWGPKSEFVTLASWITKSDSLHRNLEKRPKKSFNCAKYKLIWLIDVAVKYG